MVCGVVWCVLRVLRVLCCVVLLYRCGVVLRVFVVYLGCDTCVVRIV